MSFVNIEFLIFMMPPLFVMAYFVLKKSSNLEAIFDSNVLKKLIIDGDKLGRRGRLILILLALALMIISLARPISDKQKVPVEESRGQLMTLLDISRSMNVADIYPSRLEFAKNRIKHLFNELVGVDVGVMAFAKDAFLVSPLSSDKASVEFLLSQVESSMVSRQGTDVVNALRQSEKIFKEGDIKELLIISDGGDGREIEEAIDVANEQGVVVHVMSIGSDKGGVINTKDGLVKDEKGNIVISKRSDELSELAKKTGGVFVQEMGTGASINVIKRALQRQDIKEKRREVTIQKEWFYLPLGMAVFLLLIAFHSFPKRGVLILFLLLHVNDVKAGVFDFLHIQKSNEAYGAKNYDEVLKELDKISPSAQSQYNKSVANYRMGDFKKAIETLQDLKIEDKELKYKSLHNLGNAYAKSKKIDEAIKSYEEALKLKEDEDTRFNLELLKKQKKEQEKKKNQQKNQNQNKNQQQNKKDQDKQKEKKSDEKQNNSQNKKQDKEKSDKKKESEKNKKNKEEEKEKRANKQVQMSKEEAKKWEEKLLKDHPKTQPMRLGKREGKGAKDDAITW